MQHKMTHAQARNLLRERWQRYRYTRQLLNRVGGRGIPAINRMNLRLVLRGLLAVVSPTLEAYLRKRKNRAFMAGLCGIKDGWASCKRQKGHEGPCVYDWDEAADLL